MSSAILIEKELRRRVEGEVRFDLGARALYSTDASVYRQIPIGIVTPRHEGDVMEALAVAHENRIAILPRGGGTSLAGQGCNAALVIDFSRHMNAVREIDVKRRRAVVEPGIVLSRLNAELARYDLFFPPDPTTKDRCTIGGMIGNNSCGSHSVAYGKTVDNLTGIDVALCDGTRLKLGEISANAGNAGAAGRANLLFQDLHAIGDRYADSVRQRYPEIPRRVSGYNLDQLLPENGFNVARALVGSEGTLAVTLQAALKLAPRPRWRVLLVAGFRDIFLAADSAPHILQYKPQALEGFDGRLVEFVKATGLQASHLHLLPDGEGFLLVEFSGDSLSEARGCAEPLLEQIIQFNGFVGARIYSDEADQLGVWALRESGLGASAVIPGYPRTWPGIEDAAVAPAVLGAYLRRFAQLLQRHQLEVASYYGHFGDGCIHNRITFDFSSRNGVRSYRSAMEDFATLVAEFGGSLSGEHGDGLARSELLPRIFGPKLIGAFNEFKRAFDPDGLLNPGVLAHPYPLDSHLRFGPQLKPIAHNTYLNLGVQNGLAGAASKCVGIGKCRKLDGGTMCPSYMATKDEEQSTRGRARLLFEALMHGGVLTGGFKESAVNDALDLCLSCKGCKRECPAGVDMAAYKAEFLAHYYHGKLRPLDAWFFGRIHDFARLGSVAPRLSNWFAHNKNTSGILRRVLGIHEMRDLPMLARHTFRSWFENRPKSHHKGSHVMLFPDTFTNFFEPEVAIAAVNVLERTGYNVSIPPVDLCCGRSLYDQGMLEVARRELEKILTALTPMLKAEVPLVGLEPSCMLTFRDELPALFPNDLRASKLKQNAFLLAEFLMKNVPDLTATQTVEREALVHGHCHQKAIVGLDAEMAILEKLPGLEADQLDAGCCGMAGAFGYSRKHFEISREIGERVLFPAVRACSPDTMIIADGFSCRTQIRQMCEGKRALHFAQVLDQAATEYK